MVQALASRAPHMLARVVVQVGTVAGSKCCGMLLRRQVQ